jgi:hypothetical protein
MMARSSTWRCPTLPPKKDDLVSGVYTLPAPDDETTVAVKIIDMVGEEVLVTERV